MNAKSKIYRIAVRIDEALLEILKTMAKRDRRTISDFIRILIEDKAKE